MSGFESRANSPANAHSIWRTVGWRGDPRVASLRTLSISGYRSRSRRPSKSVSGILCCRRRAAHWRL